MSIYRSLVKKEALHLVRDRRTLLIVLVMPVVLLLLFGFAISTEVNSVRVVAAVSRHDDRSRELLTRLEANSYFDFRGLVGEQEIDALMRRGEADAALIVRPEEMQLIVDASNTATAQAAAAYVTQAVSPTGGDAAIELRTLYNPQLKSAYNFVPGILGMIFILICAIMTSVSIVSEKESGSMDLMLVSPTRPRTVILGKLTPYFGVSCVILLLMLGISYGVLDIPFTPASALNVVGVSLVYIVLSLAVGLLVSTLVETQLAALIISAMMFMIPVIMLSGMIFPVDNMPRPLQWVSAIVPARWYISAMRKLMIQQLDLRAVAAEAGILAAMAAGILALAIKRFRTSAA